MQLQNFSPERHFKTITYGAPVLDLFGTQKANEGQANVMRFSNNGDLVSAFDNSAQKTSHPNPGNYAPSFWHDFHNKEQASGRTAGVSVPRLISTPVVVNQKGQTGRGRRELQRGDAEDEYR